jgi:hypothetical protein
MAITDPFTGTNGTDIVSYSAQWSYAVGTTGDLEIQSNSLSIKDTATEAQVCAKRAGSFPNDHYAQVAIAAFDTTAGSNQYGGPAVRIGTGANFYGFEVEMASGAGTYLFKMVAGVETELGTGGLASLSTTDVIKLDATGTTITPTINGSGTNTPGAQTDSTFVDGSPGIVAFTRDVTTTGRLDDFESTDAVSGALEQEGYRWRADDGDEDAATWLASQDANITRLTGLNTRLRVLLDSTGDVASTAYQLEYKLSSAPSYQKVEPAGGGSAAYGTIGAVTTTGTTAPTVAYPASIAAGDLLILAIANRPNASTPSTPSDWTAATNYTTTGGAGSEGAGTGTVRITVFTKVAVGTETGNLTLGITSGTSCGAVMWRCTKTTGKNWSVALAIGSDNSAGTAWSVTFGSDPGVTAGDLVFVASASSEDTASFASQALSQTGVTYGTMNERADTAITTGNDLRIVVAQHAVTSGTSSAAAVYTMTSSGTNSANSAGASIMIRLRQVDQPIQLATSANITASGENTTAQLTSPTGKTTSDFTAGRIQDDENPADTVDIGLDDYSEFEWCLTATANAANADVYQFRVTANGTALGTYTLTPQWTIGAGGAITGSIALALAVASALTGDGALAGTVALSLAPSGALSGDGALASAVGLTLTPAGSLTGGGALAAAIQLALDSVGSLIGDGALAGSVALSITPTGFLNSDAAISGAISLALDTVGALTGGGALLGAVTASIDLAGVMQGDGALVGAISMALDSSGAMTGEGSLSGAIALALLPAGVITGIGALSGAIGLAFDTVGAITGDGALFGAVALGLGVTGTFDGTGAIVGAVDLAFAVSSVLAGTGSLSGSIASSLAANGVLTGYGELVATIACDFTLLGAAQGRGSITSLVDIAFGLSAEFAATLVSVPPERIVQVGRANRTIALNSASRTVDIRALSRIIN